MLLLFNLTKRLCSAIAVLALVVLFAVVAGNIVARTVFDATGGSINFLIEGAIELSSYSLLILVFGSLPVGVPSGLVRVDFLVERLPNFIQKILHVVWYLLLFVGVLVLTWLFIEAGLNAVWRGEVTQDIEIPIWIFYVVISIQTACLSFVCFFYLLASIGILSAPEHDEELLI